MLTRRAAHLRSHSGEVSFPGGGIEPGDADLRATALREAWEETALDPASVEIIGELDHLSTITSGSFIVPYVGVLPGRPELQPSAGEVDAVLHVPLAELLAPGGVPRGGVGLRRPGGATHRVLRPRGRHDLGRDRLDAPPAARPRHRHASAAASSTTTDRPRAWVIDRVHAAGRFGAGWLLGSDSVSCRSVRRCCSGPARTSAPPTRRPTRPTPIHSLWRGTVIAALVVGAFVWGLIGVGADPLPAAQRRRAEPERPYNIPLEIVYTVDPGRDRRRAVRLHDARPATTSPSSTDDPDVDVEVHRLPVGVAVPLPRTTDVTRHRRRAGAPPELVLPVGRDRSGSAA